MFCSINTHKSLRFRRWSRRSYAVFHSIGRHVTIGNVKHIVADTLLAKQSNLMSVAGPAGPLHSEHREADPDPPEDLIAAAPEILIHCLPVAERSKPGCASGALYLIDGRQQQWLPAIFYLNTKIATNK